MKTDNQASKNLIGASFSLIIAAVLLIMGTYAWFTVQTEVDTFINITFKGKADWPVEVSADYGEYATKEDTDPEKANWEKELGIDNLMIGEGNNAHLAMANGLLRPITTYDLRHWYVTQYDAEGNAKDFEERELREIANIPNIAANIADGEIEEKNNYLVYVDLWFRVPEGEEKYYLRLNNPGFENGEIQVDDFETDYGTFLMWTPVFTKDEDSKIVLDEESSINAMSSMRIGFLVYDDEDTVPYESYEDEKAAAKRATSIIYEPNGDLHKEQKAMEKAGQGAQMNMVYVQNFTDSSEAASSITASGSKVGEYTKEKENVINTHFLDTMVPMYVSDGVWTMMKQPAAIRQTASEWDMDSTWNVDGDGNTLVTGDNLKSIGQFTKLQETAVYQLDADEADKASYKDENDNVTEKRIEVTEIAGYESLNSSTATKTEIAAPYDELPVIATISKDKATRIRIFFWLEGQDIDCWNQIAGGRLYANLEFRGDPVK